MTSNKQEDLKIVVFGDGGVGKSAFVVRFIQNIFLTEYDPTIEDSYRKQFQVDDKFYFLDILDTACNFDEYSSFKDQYTRAAHVFMLLFDLNRLETLNSLETDIERILKVKDVEQFPMILVGTKCDLIKDEQIDYKVIDKFIEKHNIQFIKTSAKECININEAFVLGIDQIQNIGKYIYVKRKNKSDCEIM